MNALSLSRFTASASFAAALSACAGLPAGYGQIDGHKYHVATIDTYPVKVIRIDDRDTLDNPAFVDPGSRKITVQGPPDGARRSGEQRTIDVNVMPCMRYYLVAQKSNPLMTDFSVKIDHQESIGGCAVPASK